ncbi:MAG: metallophosphoesterase [Legionellaceae bacterium]|nr:metallophosphoesterase [Legionellaceae bacterium]
MKIIKLKLLKISLFLLMTISSLSKAASIVPNDNNNFLVIADIHLDIKSKRTMEINPTKAKSANDLDYTTFTSLLDSIGDNINDKNIKAPQFMIVLGDIQGHSRAFSNLVENESVVFTSLKRKFKNTPIFYVFGNNDSLQANYGSFSDKHQNSPYKVAMQKAGWKNGFLSTGVLCGQNQYPCIDSENKNDGYYSAFITNKLRLIGLNSVLFSSKHSYSTSKSSQEQLQWLYKELDIAKKNNDSVILAMHIPPGKNISHQEEFWNSKQQHYFLTILNQYQKNIIGILSAHTHFEEIKIVKHSSNTITPIYYTASLSTSHGNSPSFKTFSYQRLKNHWQLENYQTYNFSQKNKKLSINKLYDFQQYYSTSMINCLKNVSDKKIQTYFSAGNINFPGRIELPDNIILSLK